MGIMDRFKGQPSDDELERKLEHLKLLNQVEQENYRNEQTKAMVKDIKAKYGKSWRKQLGMSKDGEKGALSQFASARFKLM